MTGAEEGVRRPPVATVIDAWHVLAPPPGDRHGPLAPLLLGLTVVTGLVDAFSYLVLGHVFVANMTGNVVFLAFALAGAHGFSATVSLVALAGFSLGAICGGRLSVAFGAHRGRLLTLTSGLELALAAVSLVVVELAATPGRSAARFVLTLLLSVAMGAQNASARRLAVPDLTTTVLTLTLTGASADSRLGGGAGSKLGRRGLSVLAMFLGALVGSSLVLHVGVGSGIAVAVGVLTTVAVCGALVSRSGSGWVRPSVA